MNVSDIRRHFINELRDENFTVSRDGSKTIEMLGASFLADEPAIFGEPNEAYIQAELGWYRRQITNINDIYQGEKPAPKAWQYSANEYGEINSNYGYLIFSDAMHAQFENALNELIENPNSRRATMVYTRPSIWVEYNDQGKNDFICTNAVTYYIRNNALHAVVQMRSNDVVFGYKNDYAWQKQVMEDLALMYWQNTGEQLQIGDLHWQVQNLHVYERHFHLVEAQDV